MWIKLYAAVGFAMLSGGLDDNISDVVELPLATTDIESRGSAAVPLFHRHAARLNCARRWLVSHQLTRFMSLQSGTK
jgi:hypothetical protein